MANIDELHAEALQENALRNIENFTLYLYTLTDENWNLLDNEIRAYREVHSHTPISKAGYMRILHMEAHAENVTRTVAALVKQARRELSIATSALDVMNNIMFLLDSNPWDYADNGFIGEDHSQR